MQQVDVFIKATDHLHRHVAALFVGLLQHRVECLCGHSGQLQGYAGETPGFGDAQRRRVGATDRVCFAVLDFTNKDAVALRERKGQGP